MKLSCGFVLMLLGLGMFIGCLQAPVSLASKHESPPRTKTQPAAVMAVEAGGVSTPDVLPGKMADNRLKIYTGSVNLTAYNRTDAISQITSLTKQLGGYFEHLTETTLTIRVPAGKFQTMLAELAKIGEITRRDIRVVDVTDEVADLQAELQNLKAVRDRLKKLLEKSNDIKNTLAIERELNRVQTKIDQLTSMLNRMDRQIAYSKITIRLFLPDISSSNQRVRHFTTVGWVELLGLDNLYD